MFHFKRRTLWIIIYITIPLILILNSLGPETGEPGNEPAIVPADDTLWTMTEQEPDCDRHCRLVLEGSEQVRISAILSSVPVGTEPVPAGVEMDYTRRGGAAVASLRFVPSEATDARVLDFLRIWLPQQGETRWVATGAISEAFWEALLEVGGQSIGAFRPIESAPPASLTVLTAPEFGTDSQLAYLLWIEVLKQRLAGYQVTVTWDHRRQTSLILFNTTLSADVLYPVTEAEWQPVQQAYLQAAQQTERSHEQIHRYVMTSLLYDVPFDFFVRQSSRLQQVTLSDINQSRENTLAQIQ